jgi:hypothetical protein
MKTIKFVAAACMAWVAAGAWAGGEAGTMLKNDDVKAEPFRDAKTVATLLKGDQVDILQRESGWFQVKSGKGGGWVHMLSIRRGDARKAPGETVGLLSLASGRSGTGTVVSTTGIRGMGKPAADSGLSGETLQAAKFNEAELMRAESYAAAEGQAQRFADQGGLAARRIDYLPSPK